MPLHKSLFYPVDDATQTIHLDPMAKAADVLTKWGRGPVPCVAVRGARLAAPAYASYRRRPTITVESLLAEWKDEVARSHALWRSAAVVISSVIAENPPEAACKILRRYSRRFRAMAVSASYARAAKDMREAIRQAEVAS